MRTVYWADFPGNKYLKKLEPAMLNWSECTRKQIIRPIGKKRFEDRETVYVTYERSYVVSKIAIEILQPLEIKSLTELLKLMVAVWREYEKQNSKAS
ncbi:hypothetical protein IQ230_23525 [Gloeocapsopsis crepidinum LEGE 06123]|uniref:Uncharacterized protein n=1 Tax=Gloeocapsopsis crepidinum LEGE 06123 TaxID=588587 RepID=A0ABR9UY68_9CHRO|nr:hypothetical protein [Gloeocapsopsis crepidinum]MBE9193261.1 hypothetical protein [Gloeocapsopsis crepidinum LEGE 06123]